MYPYVFNSEWKHMALFKMNKKRNPMAQEVRTPKYRKRVVEDKRRKQINDDDYWIVSSYEGVETYIKKREQDEQSRFKKKKAQGS
jgi:hypothetical protein